MFPSLTARASEVKPRSPSSPGECPHCVGRCVVEGEWGPEDCPECGGYGRVVYVERPAPLPARLAARTGPVYVVTVAAGQLEEGYDLQLLVSDVVRAWRDTPDDIAVWEDRGEDGCRLLALVRPGPRGQTVQYL